MTHGESNQRAAKPDESNAALLAAWKRGDQAAAGLLFQRYQSRLLALVRTRLSRKLARRLDPEDIVLSAYRSFFVAVQNGRATSDAQDDLWPLLTTITLRKLARQARRHTADARSPAHEHQDGSDWMELVAGNGPTPEDGAVLVDEVERLLARLDETAREVLVRTLQGESVAAIAAALKLNERTVRRALERIHHELPQGDDAILIPAIPDRRVSRQADMPARPDPHLQGTTTYDQYLLRQFVGAGAFSKVYRAIDRLSQAEVAVKFLRRDCCGDERARAALLREYEILSHLKHPHILQMRGWGTMPRGALFLVTDYICGSNLATWSVGSPTVLACVEAVTCVAQAVAQANRQGVIHGDLKPANVLRREDGHLVLCDFGLARFTTDPEDVPRGGTAGFLCPEQISDEFGPSTAQADVYGLGGLLYALLTGRPPMQGRDLPDTLARVLSLSGPEPPSKWRADIPPELDAIVIRCLQKEPHQRFASADEVASGLGEVAVNLNPDMSENS